MRLGDQAVVTEPLCEGQALFVDRPARREVVGPVGDPTGGRERSDPRPHIAIREGMGQQLRGPGSGLGQLRLMLPVAPDRRGDPHPDPRFVCGQGPAHRSAQIVLFVLEHVPPSIRVLPGQVRTGGLRQREEDHRVPALAACALAGVLQAFEGELTQQGVTLESRLTMIRGPDPDQALVGQRLQSIHHRHGQLTGRVDHLLGVIGTPATAEHGDSAEDGAFVLGQEVVAPADRALKRSLPLGKVAGAAGQQVQAGLQSGKDGRWTEGSNPRRRQLDRQRQTFQAVNDALDVGEVIVVRDGVWPQETRSIHEEADPVRRIQRWDLVLVLTRYPQDLPTRDDDPQTRRAAQQIGDVAGGLRQELFEIVEDQQGIDRPEVRLKGSRDRHAGFLADVKGGRDGAVKQTGVPDRCQIHEPGPARVAVGDRRREPKTQACLAGPARAGQGQQSGVREDPPQRGNVLVAAHEVRRRRGQVRRRIDRAKRSVIVGDPGDHEEVDRPWLVEVLQTPWSHGDQAGPGWQPFTHALAGRIGHGDLSAICRRGDPSRVMDVDSDVVLAGVHESTIAGVDPHPDAWPGQTGSAGFLGEGSTERHGRAGSPDRVREDGEDAIALVLDDRAASGRYRDIRLAVVVAQQVRPDLVAKVLGESGRPLDIAEQERHVPARKLGISGWHVDDARSRPPHCQDTIPRPDRVARLDSVGVGETLSGFRVPVGSAAG